MIHPTNERYRSQANPRLLVSRLLTTTDTKVYECPAGHRAQIDLIVFCNGATSSVLLRWHHAQRDEGSIQANAQFFDTAVPASASMQDDGPRPMLEGETLRGKAGTASAISVSIYGRETPV
jgi:hypothetical protein